MPDVKLFSKRFFNGSAQALHGLETRPAALRESRGPFDGFHQRIDRFFPQFRENAV